MNFEIIDGKFLNFEIINNFVFSQPTKPKSGIGLKNIKERLKLIYKNDYTLSKQIKFNYYIVRLQIPLNNED